MEGFPLFSFFLCVVCFIPCHKNLVGIFIFLYADETPLYNEFVLGIEFSTAVLSLFAVQVVFYYYYDKQIINECSRQDR